MIDLLDTSCSMLARGKGILAADESTASADKRLAAYGITPSAEMRRVYRDLFLATPGIEAYLSGVILYEETLSQAASDGTPFPELLLSRGIAPGIKVDTGTEPMPDSPDELITNGLLGLSERLASYRDTYGTSFTKWRAVVRIDGDRLPTAQALVENARRLAQYAHLVQEAGMVPIIEPEVLLEGTHGRVRSKKVLVETWETVIRAMNEAAVDLSGVVLKSSMALSGSASGKQDTPEEVAECTVGALIETVPSTVPGIVFLSGGQTPDQATENLRAITAKAAEVHAPWVLTYSYARALQEEALAVWAGKEENLAAARSIYMERLKKVTEALAA